METKLENRNDVLFDCLVPDEGPAPTVEGEMLRAINRIYYRFNNDGDYFYKGYGVETAGPAHAYLVRSPLAKDLEPIFRAARGKEYEAGLDKALLVVLDYIQARKGEYSPNDQDMLRAAPVPQPLRCTG